MSTLKTPSFTARSIEMTLLFVLQYKAEPVWGRKGKKAHHQWHLLPRLYEDDKTLSHTAICGMDIKSNATLYCFNPVGRNEKRCSRCAQEKCLRELAE